KNPVSSEGELVRSRAAALLFPVALGVLGLSLCRAGAISAASDTVPPSDPSKLHDTAASGVQVNLSWPASTDNVGVTGYFIERCQGVACTSVVLFASVPGAVDPRLSYTYYTDAGVTSSSSYSYRVRATNGSNLSVYSNTATVMTPATPTGVFYPQPPRLR